MPLNPSPSPPLIDAAPTVASLRTLGSGAQEAMPGNRVFTQDEILAAFTISSFATPTVTLEIGASIANPTFTASYNRTAAAVDLNDGSGAIALTVAPYTSFAYGTPPLSAASYSKNTINDTQVFTLRANETGGPQKTATVTIAWRPRVYFGVTTDPGSYNEAFVEGLASNALAAARQRSIPYNSTGAQYMWYAIPTVYGGAASNFIDSATGFAAGFSKVGTVAVVANTAGAPTNNYDIWRSDVAGLGAQTISVT